MFAGSGDRRIEKIESMIVWVNGPALDPARDRFPNQIRVAVSEQRRAEWRLSLFDQAFRVAQLDFLPNSWGSSLRVLSDKIEPVAPPFGAPIHFNNMRRDADGGFTVLGPDPYVVFDISGLHLSGSQAGLLNLHFACMGQQGQPVIEVYFVAVGEVPTEDTVVRATVQDTDLLIPLNSQPRWLLASQLSLLRLDLADHRTCSRVRFDGVQLWNRKAF